MYKQQKEATILIKISKIEIFFDLEKGNIKNASSKAKPKWIARAGNPLNIPKFNQKGKGDAYQSWNKDQIIAIAATVFKCSPVRFLVGDKSSWILVSIDFSIFWFICESYCTIKKRPNKYIGPFNLYLIYFDYINPASL